MANRDRSSILDDEGPATQDSQLVALSTSHRLALHLSPVIDPVCIESSHGGELQEIGD
jgi:hypothetical protein